MILNCNGDHGYHIFDWPKYGGFHFIENPICYFGNGKEMLASNVFIIWRVLSVVLVGAETCHQLLHRYALSLSC